MIIDGKKRIHEKNRLKKQLKFRIEELKISILFFKKQLFFIIFHKFNSNT